MLTDREFIFVFIVAFLIFVFSQAAKADQVLLGGVSYHITSDDTTNYFHRAVMYNHDKYLVGYARNSYDQDSFVAAYELFSHSTQYLTIDLYGGAVRGYDKCYGRASGSKVAACPLGILSVHFKTNTDIQPTVSLWGDALVGTARIEF